MWLTENENIKFLYHTMEYLKNVAFDRDLMQLAIKNLESGSLFKYFFLILIVCYIEKPLEFDLAPCRDTLVCHLC